MIAPFVDHNSKQRIQFVESEKHAATLMPKFLDMSMVERCLSGTSDYTYRCAAIGCGSNPIGKGPSTASLLSASSSSLKFAQL